MTREQHISEYERLYKIGMEKLGFAIECNEEGFDRSAYEEHRQYIKQANRHYGIASAMWKRKMKKLYGFRA